MDRGGALDEEGRLDRRRTLVDVNGHIRDAAVSFDGVEAEAAWEFMCECGVADCRALVRLTVRDYDRLKASAAPILAAGHELSRSLRARRKSESLVEEATALAAEAAQQVRRARVIARRLADRDAAPPS